MGFSGGDQRKVPSCFQREEWKSNHFETAQSILFSTKKLFHQSLTHWVFPEPHRERKSPTPAPAALRWEREYRPSSPGCPDSLREGRDEEHCEGAARDTGSLETMLTSSQNERTLPLAPYPTCTQKGLFTTVPFTWYIRPCFHQNHKAH